MKISLDRPWATAVNRFYSSNQWLPLWYFLVKWSPWPKYFIITAIWLVTGPKVVKGSFGGLIIIIMVVDEDFDGGAREFVEEFWNLLMKKLELMKVEFWRKMKISKLINFVVFTKAQRFMNGKQIELLNN